MVGSSGDVNQGTTVGGAKRACRGQSVRSSWEAGNDRGAKGRRNVVVADGLEPSQKDRRSAARLCASVRRRVAWGQCGGGQWAAWEQVSGAERLARLVRCFCTPCDESLTHQDHELESRMRENRLSGLGGRGRGNSRLLPTSFPLLPATSDHTRSYLGSGQRLGIHGTSDLPCCIAITSLPSLLPLPASPSRFPLPLVRRFMRLRASRSKSSPARTP